MAVDALDPSWNISLRGAEIITENNTVTNKATILKNALNSDLKEIGSPIINKLQNQATVSKVVLQIQKLRNVSAPKANEKSQAAPRMLKLVLTDGENYIQAVEISPLAFLSLEKTPPGSKLLIHTAKLCSGYLLLESNSCSLLGGQVPALYEKWEVAKSVQFNHRQNNASDGAPAWVNFGGKLQSEAQDKSFKSLESKSELKENTKFDLQRQDAIAEATSGAVKKVFGGGVKLQTPIVRDKKPEFKERKSKKNFAVKDVEEKLQKPPERVSLFDFLEDKLPEPQIESKPQTYSKFEQNEAKSQNYNKFDRYEAKSQSYNKFDRNDAKSQSYNKFDRNDAKLQNYNKFDRNEAKSQNYNKFERNEAKSQNYNKIEQNSYRGQNQYKRTDYKEKNDREVQDSNVINGLTNNFNKMSLNTQFASRSLKEHLNLPAQRKEIGSSSWKIGDECMAKYWEDGKFYNANVTAVTETTCVVKFKGYGNIEEVLKTDCLPVASSDTKKTHSGPDFRRNTRTFRRQ